MTVTQHLDVASISEQARQVRFWHTVGSVVATVLFVIGWSAFKLFSIAWFCCAWSAVAVREGWREAKNPAAKFPS